MNNKTLTIIGIVIIILLIIYYFYNQSQGKNREGGTESGTDGTNGSTSSSTTATSTPTSGNTSVNTGAGTGSANTSTSTGSGNPNQITLTKQVPVYYLQLPTQAGYPHKASDNAVANVTLPQGKALTITKVWNFGSTPNPNLYYETSEKVMYISNPSQHGIGDYYLIKKSDL